MTRYDAAHAVLVARGDACAVAGCYADPTQYADLCRAHASSGRAREWQDAATVARIARRRVSGDTPRGLRAWMEDAAQ